MITVPRHPSCPSPGGQVQTSVNNLIEAVQGSCALFEERQIGGDRYNFFTGCKAAKTCTIILRGGAQQFIAETERSLHDAIMIVRRAMKNDAVVAGGGAIEMLISKHLRDYARGVPGKQQLLIAAYAKALEIIPRQLCDNAGFDATNVLNKLRQKHAQGTCWFGVDIRAEDISDNYEAAVWEPAIVKVKGGGLVHGLLWMKHEGEGRSGPQPAHLAVCADQRPNGGQRSLLPHPVRRRDGQGPNLPDRKLPACMRAAYQLWQGLSVVLTSLIRRAHGWPAMFRPTLERSKAGTPA